MLNRFTVKRYRNLDVDNLELARLNLLVGPNNAGKSNFHKAIQFAAELFVQQGKGSAFLATLASHGHGDVLDRASAIPGDVELAWTLSPVPGAKPLVYDLGFRVDKAEGFPAGFYITKERLRDESAEEPLWLCERDAKSPSTVRFAFKEEPLTLQMSPQETMFQQREELLMAGHNHDAVQRFLQVAVRDLRSYFGGFQAYTSADIYPHRVAAAVLRDMSIRHLDRDGIQLANVLRHLDQHEGLDEYTRILGQMIPDLRRVKPIDVSDEQVAVRLHIGDGRPLKLNEMSDGTIKAMILALLVSTPVRMSLLALDEPELNLHPAWLRILGKWLLECRSADQLIISTHSPDLLDAFTEAFREGTAALFVFSAPHRGVRRIEPKELDSFFQEGWELGDLYRVGEPKLGGWPW